MVILGYSLDDKPSNNKGRLHLKNEFRNVTRSVISVEPTQARTESLTKLLEQKSAREISSENQE